MRVLLVLAAMMLFAQSSAARAQALTVFAAASLTDAMRTIAADWAKQGHPMPSLSFAASSTLARQIEQGAPANIFASADEQWMDYLAARNLIVPETRKDVLGNALVLVVPADRAREMTIGPGLDLAALLGTNGRLAVGDPASVPAGIYARQALTKLGLWDQVKSRLAPAEDVRAALLLVERGEAAAGVVYGSDAKRDRLVSIAGVFPSDAHDPILYPFAIVRAGDVPEARALLHFLEGPEAKTVFAALGFAPE